MRFCLVVLTALIAACATPEQLAARQAAYQQALESRCTGYGYKPETLAFMDCVKTLDIAVQRQRGADNAAAMQQGIMLMQQGAPQPIPGYVPPAPQAPVRTYCRPDGTGGVNCISR